MLPDWTLWCGPINTYMNEKETEGFPGVMLDARLALQAIPYR